MVGIPDAEHSVLLYIPASQGYYLQYYKHNQEIKQINLVLIQKPHQKTHSSLATYYKRHSQQFLPTPRFSNISEEYTF